MIEPVVTREKAIRVASQLRMCMSEAGYVVGELAEPGQALDGRIVIAFLLDGIHFCWDTAPGGRTPPGELLWRAWEIVGVHRPICLRHYFPTADFTNCQATQRFTKDCHG